MINLKTILDDETERRRAFPVAGERIYMAHAGVTALPRRAAEAMTRYAEAGSRDNQEAGYDLPWVDEARTTMGQLIGAKPEEVALLGPTSLGLSLVANGLDWQAGDEVVFYGDDYPANVYPWRHLEGLGVRSRMIETDWPGVITWDHVEAALSPRTKLVALASCHFLSGYRIDVDGIGRRLGEREVLFCVDGIQTIGAFPTPLDHVDFMSADSHKWMLGPASAGVFYVKASRQEMLRPTLLGAFNVVSPQFVAQEDIRYYGGARRYEPGILNLPGIAGMAASAEWLTSVGVEAVGRRLLDLRRALLDGLRPLGYALYLEEYDRRPEAHDGERSSIVTLRHPERDMREVFKQLREHQVSGSLRQNRAGEDFVRLSPHVYNTLEEVERVVSLMG